MNKHFMIAMTTPLVCSSLIGLGVSAKAEPIPVREEHVVSDLPFFALASTEFDSEAENDLRLLEELSPLLDSIISFTRTSGIGTETSLPDSGPLPSRLISFAMNGPESIHGWVRNGYETNGIIIRPKKLWTEKFSLEEVAIGRARNRVARRILLKTIRTRLTSQPETIQIALFQAAETIWISGRPLTDGAGSPEERRAEDGIPSAEALLFWFAENESLCETVRKEARQKLEHLSATR